MARRPVVACTNRVRAADRRHARLGVNVRALLRMQIGIGDGHGRGLGLFTNMSNLIGFNRIKSD